MWHGCFLQPPTLANPFHPPPPPTPPPAPSIRQTKSPIRRCINEAAGWKLERRKPAFICIYVLCQLIWRLFAGNKTKSASTAALLTRHVTCYLLPASCHLPPATCHLVCLPQFSTHSKCISSWCNKRKPLPPHLHTICAYSLVWSASINTPRHQACWMKKTAGRVISGCHPPRSNQLPLSSLLPKINKPFLSSPHLLPTVAANCCCCWCCCFSWRELFFFVCFFSCCTPLFPTFFIFQLINFFSHTAFFSSKQQQQRPPPTPPLRHQWNHLFHSVDFQCQPAAAFVWRRPGSWITD